MKTIAIRLLDGQDLLAEIATIATRNSIKAGVVLSAVGSLRQSAIRVPVLDGQLKLIHPENVEIDSLQGTVSKDGLHLHVTVSDVEGRAWGGHLKEGCIVRTTCELVVGIIDGKSFRREMDEDTGFKELVIDQEVE